MKVVCIKPTDGFEVGKTYHSMDYSLADDFIMVEYEENCYRFRNSGDFITEEEYHKLNFNKKIDSFLDENDET